MNHFSFEASSDFHNRPCMRIVEFVRRKMEKIHGLSMKVHFRDQTVMANSIIGLTLLGIHQGDTFEVTIEAEETIAIRTATEFRNLILQISEDPSLEKTMRHPNIPDHLPESLIEILETHLQFLEKFYILLQDEAGEIHDTTYHWIQTYFDHSTYCHANIEKSSHIENMRDIIASNQGSFSQRQLDILKYLVQQEIIRLQLQLGKITEADVEKMIANIALMEMFITNIARIKTITDLRIACEHLYETFPKDDITKISYLLGHKVGICSKWSEFDVQEVSLQEIKHILVQSIKTEIIVPVKQMIKRWQNT